MSITLLDQTDKQELEDQILELKDGGSGLTDLLKNSLRTYFVNMQTLLTQLAYISEDNISPTVINNAQSVVTALDTVVTGELTSITAVYSGGNVPAGANLDDLKNKLIVTAHYDDGTSLQVTGYTLSGEIVVGENTITVTYRKLSTTFTVTGLASYSITYNLTNVESTSSVSAVISGESYETTLSYEAGDDVEFIIVVTMGGTDVTDQVYNDGVISISEVTGNIVITAKAVSSFEYIDLSQYLKKENSQINTIYQGTTIRWADVDGHNIYSVPVTAGTYRMRLTNINTQYTTGAKFNIQNTTSNNVETSKLPLLSADTDLSSNSIQFTEAESVTHTITGESKNYTSTLDIVFATDGYFLFSLSTSENVTLAKVVA